MRAWFTSRYSAGNGNCVEVSFTETEPEAVWVRHSLDPDGPTLAFTHDGWDAFVSGAKEGEFDLEGRHGS